MTGSLDGLRILDLTRIMAGPSATQTLGDLGADVIKLERPKGGDDTRRWGPPFVRDKNGDETEESVYFQSANRNKRSITVNLSSPDGQDIVRRLAAASDVLFENYKVGGLARYGLDYAHLEETCPRLVYCSLTGFGQTGPYAARAGYDLLAQAMGGLMSITGPESGEPIKVGVAISDILTGMQCAIAILAALRHRDATGRGQHIDMALLDTQVAWLVNEGMNYLHTGQVPLPWGTGHATIVPFQSFPTADGSVIIAVGNDTQFGKFCDFAGVPELAADVRYATNRSRVGHRGELVETVSEITRRQTTRHWLDGLAELGVPVAAINNIEEAFADPQVQARGMTVGIEHPAAGRAIPYIASPINLSKTPVSYRRPAPTLGQHTDEVLKEVLGLDDGAIAALREKGAL